MTLTAQQLERRQQGVGASEVAAVLGLDPYRTPFDVWYSKVYPGERVQVQTDAMRRGHRLEPVVADMYAEAHPGVLLEVSDTCARRDAEWALATPDRIVLAPSGATGLLEIKTKRWHTARVWGETGTQDVPLLVVAQCQWQMWVVDRPWCDVALLIDGEEYREYHLERDDESIAAMVEEVARFWMFHVRNQIAPEMKGERVASYLAHRYQQRSAELALATPEAELLLQQLARVKSDRKLAELEEEHVTNLLKAEVGERRGITGAAGRFTWAEQAGGIDYKAAAESLGLTKEQAEAFRRPSFRAARFTATRGEG